MLNLTRPRMLVLAAVLASATFAAGRVEAKPVDAKPVVAKPAKSASAKTTGAKTTSKKGAKKVPKNAPVQLYAVNRRETMALKLRDGKGRPVKGMQRRFDHFLRCHYTNVEHKMDPRLMRLLFQTGHHWPGRRLEVVSGYRHPTVAKNPHSPHMKGLACDFRVEGVKTAELRDYLRKTYDKVGVGYYPNSSFVHLDVRKDRSAFWIDYSGPGERSIYSETPNQDLKDGRAETYHPSKIDSSWVEDGDAKGEGTSEPSDRPAAEKAPETP